MKFLLEIEEGGEIPFGWGIAWRRWYCNRTVCLPIPINIFAGLAHRALRWAAHALRKPTELEKHDLKTYFRGYGVGYDRGYAHGRGRYRADER